MVLQKVQLNAYEIEIEKRTKKKQNCFSMIMNKFQLHRKLWDLICVKRKFQNVIQSICLIEILFFFFE